MNRFVNFFMIVVTLIVIIVSVSESRYVLSVFSSFILLIEIYSIK
jgi:hypothetical protein